MNIIHVCAVCESTNASVRMYSERVKVGRRYIEVEGLKKLDCLDCGMETVSEEMHDANLARIRSALDLSRATVSRGQLRDFREAWVLSQRDASAIFGAGANSFAKWESGQAELSTPAALLIQCAMQFPEVMLFLGSLSEMKLVPPRSTARRHGAYETVRLQVDNCANGTKFHSFHLSKSKAHGRAPGATPDEWDQEIVSHFEKVAA